MINLLKNILKNLGRKPATRLYPFEKREPFPGSRGHIDMTIETCIFCGACEKRCPANAIKVTRDPKSWTIDRHACILCGYCVEVCPKDCIFFKTEHYKPTV
jgi:ech hydrogenase subunit F